MAAVQHLNLYLNLIQWSSELGLASLLLVILVVPYVGSVCQQISDGRHVAFLKTL